MMRNRGDKGLKFVDQDMTTGMNPKVMQGMPGFIFEI